MTLACFSSAVITLLTRKAFLLAGGIFCAHLHLQSYVMLVDTLLDIYRMPYVKEQYLYR